MEISDRTIAKPELFSKKTVEELFEGYCGDYQVQELDAGLPVGREEI